jgi:hypothetical protein
MFLCNNIYDIYVCEEALQVTDPDRSDRFLQHVLQDLPQPDHPVLALHLCVVAQLLETGTVQGFLAKPYEPGQLFATVARLMRTTAGEPR